MSKKNPFSIGQKITVWDNRTDHQIVGGRIESCERNSTDNGYLLTLDTGWKILIGD